MDNEEKVTAEKGQFNWAAGRGYQPPAGGGGAMPPGWGEAPPGYEAPAQYPEPEPIINLPVEPPVQLDGQKMVPPDSPDLEQLQILTAYYSGALAPVPAERVNLDDGTATYNGHMIELSEDGVQAIKTVLAMEVCRMLDEEKERVAKDAGLLVARMQEPSGAGAPDVSEVSGTPKPVEQEA